MRTARLKLVARNLAAAVLSDAWTAEAMALQLESVIGRGTRISQRRLVAEIFAHHKAAYPPAPAALAKFILTARYFERAAGRQLRGTGRLRLVLRSPQFAPVLPVAGIDVLPLPTSGDIAEWLGIAIEELDWFTDARRQHGRTAIPVMQHYTYAFRAKRIGPPRLIEAPKPRLKTMQRRILHAILDRVPTHDAAHGFVAGRSCRSHAELHVGAAVVVCLDLADFFVTTPLGRVHALFRSLGYPYAAAQVLTGLCSTVTPESVFNRLSNPARHTREAYRIYREPHLPQGAPTSPTLANLVAWCLDVRLTGLAKSYGARYSRYADDLTFSGDADFAGKANSLIDAVAVIAEDEGYSLNTRKARIMTSGQRQQVTGIVVNSHLNVARDSYDVLKATLHNCRRHGLDAENRDGHADFRAHLAGRIGWVEQINPGRAKRLGAIFDRIPKP